MRRGQIGFTASAIAVALWSLNTGPIAAQIAVTPTAFTCSNDLFFLFNEGTGGPGDEATANLVKLVVTGETAAFDPIGSAIAGGLNALGYNPADDFLYAIGYNGSVEQGERSGHLFRIGSNGVTADLGIPTGIDPMLQYTAGTFIAPNRLLVSSSSGTGFPIYDVIDLPTNAVVQSVTATQETRAFDWATNPLDNKIYGILFPEGRLTTLDPATGAITPFGAADGADRSMGSAWFQNSGQMLLFGASIERPDNGPQDTVFLADAGVDASGSGHLTTLASGPSAGNTDGASCVSLGNQTTTSTTSTTSTSMSSSTSTTSTELAPVVVSPKFTG